MGKKGASRQVVRQWTTEETDQLLSLVQAGETLELVSQQIDRSKNAIVKRLIKVGIDKMQSGTSVDDAHVLTGVDVDTLQDTFIKKIQVSSQEKQKLHNVKPAKSKDILWRLHDQLVAIAGSLERLEVHFLVKSPEEPTASMDRPELDLVESPDEFLA